MEPSETKKKTCVTVNAKEERRSVSNSMKPMNAKQTAMTHAKMDFVQVAAEQHDGPEVQCDEASECGTMRSDPNRTGLNACNRKTKETQFC